MTQIIADNYRFSQSIWDRVAVDKIVRIDTFNHPTIQETHSAIIPPLKKKTLLDSRYK